MSLGHRMRRTIDAQAGDDAANVPLHRSLIDGERVRLSNEQGAVILTLRISDAIRSGTLYVEKGSWLETSETGQTINALIPGHTADLGDGACYNDTQVDIAPA